MEAAEPQIIAAQSSLQWRPWRPRFGLRTLLGIVLLWSIGLAVWIRPSQQQRRAVVAIRKARGWVEYDRERNSLHIRGRSTPRQSWLCQRVGPDYFASVSHAGLPMAQVTDTMLGHLSDLTGLHALYLTGLPVSDTQVASIGRLTNLQELFLYNIPVGDADLAQLTWLTGLKRLELVETQVSDAGLANLSKLTRLQRLSLAKAQLSGVGLSHLRGLPDLEWLDLNGSEVTDVSLEPLSELRGLRVLLLRDTQLTDADRSLLRALLPNCTIVP